MAFVDRPGPRLTLGPRLNEHPPFDDVVVVVVTHQSGAVISRCLASILDKAPPTVPVIVVDNASTDQTRTLVQALESRVRLVSQDTNAGFGAACNAGAKLCPASKWYVFVNPDVVLTRFDAAALLSAPDDLGHVGQLAFECREIGSRGKNPVLRPQVNPWRDLWRKSWGCLIPPRLWSRIPQFSGRRARHRWVSGALMAVSRDAWLTTGGFDPRFFLYYEDADFSRRIGAAGFDVRASDSICGLHSQCTGSSGVATGLRAAWSVSGWLVYARKWHGRHFARALWAVFNTQLVLIACLLCMLACMAPSSTRVRGKRREVCTVLRETLAAWPRAGQGTARNGRPSAVISRAID